MNSFETLDTDYKEAMGCRGVGRLLWLKAFDRVTVRSAYKDGVGELRGRQFRFSVEREVEQDGEADGFTDIGAAVWLDGFTKSFQQSAAEDRRRHSPRGVRALHLVLPPARRCARGDGFR